MLDTSTNSVIATVTVGDGPLGVAVNPAGSRVWVANEFIPTAADQPQNARRCADLGLGQVLNENMLDPTMAERQCWKSWATLPIVRMPRSYGWKFEGLPGAEEAVTLLESLASS